MKIAEALLIVNVQVWDIRTFHLLRQVPQLDQTTVVFTNDGEVMYAVNLDQEVDDDTKFETAFKTFDASDYSLIATIETKKSVLGVCPSWDDCNVAVIEQVNSKHWLHVLYFPINRSVMETTLSPS